MGYAAIATLVITAVSAYSAQQAQSAQVKYQAQVANNNKKIAEIKAVDAVERGQLEERKHRIQIAQIMGEQRAGAAGRGVLVDAGSAQDIAEDTAAVGELEALTIRSNAEREALGFRQQAGQFATEGAFLGEQASSLKSGSLLAGAGAATSVAAKWN
jgi:hypothetical protein